MEPLVFERNDRVYLVTPVAPFQPASSEIEEYAFAEALMKSAPNPNIGWMRGQYVEAEKANLNGHIWRTNEVAIKSLTPMYMPVTVMHDPRTAVGLIADTKLLVPEKDGVPRARIDNTLAVWRHRFPETWAEAEHNYEAGTLMQSMECLPTFYDCAECGQRFPKLPGGAEKANWCAHLRGEENAKAARILGNVCFTGTGLIFGTRGAQGAYTDAHLEVFQDEVAEYHEKVHRDKSTAKTARRKHTMEIEDRDYQELVAKAGKVDDLQSKVTSLEETAAKVPELEQKVEAAEAEKTKAETERDEEKKKREELEEGARAETLKSTRFDSLGKDFVAKLGDFTKGRLEEQAKSYSDDEWENRLKELEEIAGVKRDAGGDANEDKGGGSGDGGTVSREETASTGAGRTSNNGGDGAEPSAAARRSVVAGLRKATSKT